MMLKDVDDVGSLHYNLNNAVDVGLGSVDACC